MARNTDLSTILFPVELRPVGYIPSGSDTDVAADGADTDGNAKDFKSIARYKAVVRGDTGTVFAVVSSQYELLHNSRALDLGRKAFEQLFPKTSASDFVVYDIQTTKTGSACHIDLIHNQYSTEVWEQETWLPFLRVSNSYNRYRALSFDFGFVRKLCSNGMIFRKETIRARFYHTRNELEVDIAQTESFKKLKELEAEFSAHMNRLRQIEIGAQRLLPLSIFLLGIEFDLQNSNAKKAELEAERFDAVVAELRKLIIRYVEELGETAYTALNVATDFATHSPAVAGRFSTSALLQQAIGKRSQEFLQLRDLLSDDIDVILAEHVPAATWPLT